MQRRSRRPNVAGSHQLSGFGSGLVGRLLKRQLLAAIRTENEGFQRAAEPSRRETGSANAEV